MTNELETLTHRLILPREANHHGTLYAGSLVALALEAAYSTGYRAIGTSANLVLKRVVDLRCLEPVPIGEVVQIRGVVLFQRSAQIVVGLYGSPLRGREKPWMDALMQFVQMKFPSTTHSFSLMQKRIVRHKLQEDFVDFIFVRLERCFTLPSFAPPFVGFG